VPPDTRLLEDADAKSDAAGAPRRRHQWDTTVKGATTPASEVAVVDCRESLADGGSI
jgi:hypothetical protein